MTIAIISILIITAVVWLANKFMSLSVCPVCAGVFLTWVWLLGAYNFGYQIDVIIPALLMGGTVVGIMYQLEKRFSNLSAGRLLLWKIVFVSAGFAVMYGILEKSWTVSILAIVFLLVTLIPMQKTRPRDEVKSDLEKNIKDCC